MKEKRHVEPSSRTELSGPLLPARGLKESHLKAESVGIKACDWNPFQQGFMIGNPTHMAVRGSTVDRA